MNVREQSQLDVYESNLLVLFVPIHLKKLPPEARLKYWRGRSKLLFSTCVLVALLHLVLGMLAALFVFASFPMVLSWWNQRWDQYIQKQRFDRDDQTDVL